MEAIRGRVVIVTAASSGIGEATARRLARDGARVVLVARRVERLERLQVKIAAAGGEALVVPVDILRADQVRSMVRRVLSVFGQVDALINNAGIMPLSLMRNLHVDEWERTIDVNLKGVLYGIAAVLPVFREQGRGHIINISSAAGRRVYTGAAVYCATKHAVRAISEGLRMELSPSDGIRVSVVEPGAVKTESGNAIKDEEILKAFRAFYGSITPLEPEDVAEAIAYALRQPQRVNVDEILITPREQVH